MIPSGIPPKGSIPPNLRKAKNRKRTTEYEINRPISRRVSHQIRSHAARAKEDPLKFSQLRAWVIDELVFLLEQENLGLTSNHKKEWFLNHLPKPEIPEVLKEAEALYRKTWKNDSA